MCVQYLMHVRQRENVHCLKLDDTLFCGMGIRTMQKSKIYVVCLDMETVIELFLSYAFTFCRRSVKLKVLWKVVWAEWTEQS